MGDNSEQRNTDRSFNMLSEMLAKYAAQNPDWTESTYAQLLYGSVYSLRKHIEDPAIPEISWKNPYAELRYPVDANLETLETYYIRCKEEELEDEGKAVNILTEAFLKTKETAVFRALSYDLSLLKEEEKLYLLSGHETGTAEYKNQEAKLKELEQEPPIVLPPLIATTKNKKGQDRKTTITLNLKMGNPLIFDRDLGEAYHPVYVGMDIKGYSPTRWSKEDKAEFWEQLLETIQKSIPEEDLDFTEDQAEPKAKPISREQALVKVPLHAERQKLGGRKRSRQLDIDDILSHLELKGQEAAATSIGIPLSESETKALFAIQKLLDATNYQGNTEGTEVKARDNTFFFEGYLPSIRFKPSEYLDAYGVTKFETKRGYMEYSKAERDHALKTLFDLAKKQYVICYTRKMWETVKGKPVEKEKLIRSLSPLFRMKETYDKPSLTEEEENIIKAGALTEVTLKKLEHITLEPCPLLVDQIDSYFLLKPADIYKDVARLTPEARKHKYLYKFIDYLLISSEDKRRTKTGWTIKIHFRDLAETLEMYPWIDNRKWKQIRRSLEECYRIALVLGYLESYQTKQGVKKDYEELIINPEKVIRTIKEREKMITGKDNYNW